MGAEMNQDSAADPAASPRACVVYDERLTAYNFGPSHPMAPIRIQLTMELARALGVVDLMDVVGATALTDDDLARVHDRTYIERVRKLSAHPVCPDLSIGLGSEDNPVFHGMHEASALIAGASVEAARRVWTGERSRAAMRDRKSTRLNSSHVSISYAVFCLTRPSSLVVHPLSLHDALPISYIERVRKLSAHPVCPDLSIGLGSEDNPVFHGMHEASALIAGASVEAARRVWTGERSRAAM